MDCTKSTIAQLWNGEIEPVLHLGKNDTEIKKLEELIRINFEKLEKSLDDPLKERLENYRDCLDEYTVLISEQAFCSGFCLGTRLTAEAFTAENE